MTPCACFLSSAVVPVDSPEKLEETTQEEQLLLARLFCEEQLFISLLCLNSDFTC